LQTAGIIRAPDTLGRFVIPKDLVLSLGFEKGQNFNITVDDEDNIILSPCSISQGVTRALDTLNRIVIPNGTRKKLRIHESTYFEILFDKDSRKVILKKYPTQCSLCGNLNELYDVPVTIKHNNKNQKDLDSQEIKAIKLCRCCIESVKQNL